jgi:hypothetical protein
LPRAERQEERGPGGEVCSEAAAKVANETSPPAPLLGTPRRGETNKIVVFTFFSATAEGLGQGSFQGEPTAISIIVNRVQIYLQNSGLCLSPLSWTCPGEGPGVRFYLPRGQTAREEEQDPLPAALRRVHMP